MLEVPCACGQVRRVPVGMAGKTVRCRCGQKNTAPDADQDDGEEPGGGGRGKTMGVAAAAFLVLFVALKVSNTYMRAERTRRLSGGGDVAQGPRPLTPEEQAKHQQAAERATREREAEARAREEAKKKAAARAEARAAKEKAGKEKAAVAKEELTRLQAVFGALRGACQAALEQAFTARGRELAREGARVPWSLPALRGVTVEYEVTSVADDPAPVKGRVRLSLTDSIQSHQCADGELLGWKELEAALDRLQTIEREHGLPVTRMNPGSGQLGAISFYRAARGETHEVVEAEERVSVTVPAGTFTGKHLVARHQDQEYELWFGDESPLPWRVLLPERRGCRPTVELVSLQRR